MTAKKGHFDATAFYEALDSTRLAKQITWRQVAKEAGISASTLTRMAQGKRPDVDSLAALASWSGLSTDEFVRSSGSEKMAEPLAMISTYLKADPNLTHEAAIALDELVKAAYARLRRKNDEASERIQDRSEPNSQRD